MNLQGFCVGWERQNRFGHRSWGWASGDSNMLHNPQQTSTSSSSLSSLHQNNTTDYTVQGSQVSDLRSDIGCGRSWHDDLVGGGLGQLLFNVIHEQISKLITCQDIDVVIEFHPREDVWVVLVGGDIDGGLFKLFLEWLYQLDSLLNGSRGAAPRGQGHELFFGGTEGGEQAVMCIVHHFGRVF